MKSREIIFNKNINVYNECLHTSVKLQEKIQGKMILGSVLVYDFWTPTTHPPPINFVHDHLFFSKFIII